MLEKQIHFLHHYTNTTILTQCNKWSFILWLMISTSLLGLNDRLMLFAALIASTEVMTSAYFERGCDQLISRNTHAHLSWDNDE